jgi:hypothetical protein
MSRAAARQGDLRRPAPPSPFAQGYHDAWTPLPAMNRSEYARRRYPDDPVAQIQYIDAWLLKLREEEQP